MRKDANEKEPVITADDILEMGFDKYQERFTRTSRPLTEAGKRFLKSALSGNRQVPGRQVQNGQIQDGEFD